MLAGRAQHVAAGRLEISERSELGGHDSAVAGALERIAREHPREEVVEGLRDVRLELADARRHLEQHLREDRDLVLARERWQPGEALEQDRAEREHIRARIQLLGATGLLGCHVPECSEHDAGVGDRARTETHAGNPEVDQRRVVAVRVSEDEIAGLYIAVDDALRVRGGERLREARDHPDALTHGEARASKSLAERLSRHPLHREVGFVIVGLAMRDVAHDPGVAQLFEDARLSVEPLAVLALVTPIQDLDRDDGAGLSIQCPENRGHAARADAALDLESLCKNSPRFQTKPS